MTLMDLLKDSAYKLTQFSQEQIQTLENSIIEKETRGKITPYVMCLIRDKEIKLTPEEAVRQLYLMVLLNDLNYPRNRIALEYGVTFGRETKRADICIFDKDRPTVPYILVELKKPKLKDGKEQLKSYCNATGAPMGVWSNGDSISYYQRKDPNYFEDIPALPKASEKLSDVLSERWTIEDLIKHDKLVKEKKSLKDLILEMEDEVLANAGVDVFEELFKLIFTKLYDEMEGWRDKKQHLVFKNYGDTETELKTKIQNLFIKACAKWTGVFSDDAKLQLTPSHLAVCVSSLEGVKLFNSNLDVVDEAFEYLINKSSKGEKGQYFTPRYVIDMCVKMLNPQEHETLIDTAAGSCGFPVHGIFHVWESILKQEGLTKSHLFTAEQKPPRCIDYVQNKVFAIDFDEKAVRVGRTLNLIAGDGQTNVLHLNTLDFERWDEKTKDEDWQAIYGAGWHKLRKLRTHKDDNRDFEFDILMANPPFAGDIKENRILAKYELGKKDNGKYQSNVGRDILFIERNLNFLKAGGRMAVVLPQGRFNNSSDKQIREFIAQHCRLLAVVGLHGNVFKPHTGTKTSVLFVQKWHDTLCPKVEDYPIFFATMQEPSKDNSGDKIYVTQTNGLPLLDSHEHLIVKHDLFNHDDLTQDGIAEAFIEFAKKEKLSFFDCDLASFKNLLGHNTTGGQALPDSQAKPDLKQAFNAIKYRELLDRLEVSEVMFSKIDLSDRYDAEYFWKDSLHIQELLEKRDAIKFNKIGEFVASAFYPAATHLYESGDTPFIRCVDCINYPLITKEQDNFFEKIPLSFANESGGINLLKKGDFVITKVGSPCYTSIIEEHELVALSRTVLGVKDIKNVDSYYLLAFLRSRYGFNQLLRQRELTIQYQLTLARVKNILIYIAELELQQKVHELISFYIAKKKQSQNLYAQAENLLLNALGMANFSPSTEKVNIKSFKDSFLETGRLDAEYYQLKYEQIEHKIKTYNSLVPTLWRGNESCTAPAVREAERPCLHSHAEHGNEKTNNYGIGYLYLSDLVTIQKSIETGSEAYADKGIPYIRVSNLNKLGMTMPDICISDSYYHANKKVLDKLTLKKDTILFSKDGSIGIAYKVTENLNMLTSGALLHLTIKNKHEILPDCLTLILNSELVQKQAERDAGGSIIIHWRVSEIEKVLIPLLDLETQTQIADLVQQSFQLKAQSEQLLSVAKRAVEIAIEENETAAMNYIK